MVLVRRLQPGGDDVAWAARSHTFALDYFTRRSNGCPRARRFAISMARSTRPLVRYLQSRRAVTTSGAYSSASGTPTSSGAHADIARAVMLMADSKVMAAASQRRQSNGGSLRM